MRRSFTSRIIALISYKLKLNYFLKGITWHGSLGDFFVVNFPDIRHVHHAHPAQGAGVVTVRQHLVEAGLVNEMVAGGDLGGDP